MSQPTRNPFRESNNQSFPFVTFLIAIMSVVLSVGFWVTGMHDNTWGHVTAERLWGGDWGGLITTTFLHANPLQNPFHLLFNLLWLVRIGSLVERVLGRLEFAVFCAIAGLAASGTEIAINGGSTGIGLSGVVYALFGLVWGARRTYPAFAALASSETTKFMIGWLVLCIVLTQVGSMNVANGAHVGGLIFGVGVAWLFVARPVPVRFRIAGGVALALLAALTVCAVTYMPWSPRWRAWHDAAAVTPPVTDVTPSTTIHAI